MINDQCPGVVALNGMSHVLSYKSYDSCTMHYMTQDLDLANKLKHLIYNRDILYTLMRSYYPIPLKHSVDKTFSYLSVIVSHHHGYSKQITLNGFNDSYFKNVDEKYTFEIRTCPGSSGAQVVVIPHASYREIPFTH
jgi:hypothetical protein